MLKLRFASILVPWSHNFVISHWLGSSAGSQALRSHNSASRAARRVIKLALGLWRTVVFFQGIFLTQYVSGHFLTTARKLPIAILAIKWHEPWLNQFYFICSLSLAVLYFAPINPKKLQTSRLNSIVYLELSLARYISLNTHTTLRIWNSP
ncbi:hypothetical protein DSO57_1007201 [Entomophthora muscae]|uniref:Uncharacterized protein n=1 Tax=Entomophthora muscae TaxID=34485 RepID=A0ACC2TIN4_9FUNG|nr:hypothetical protein DSO57_1007201 [Entomophthora muscae]